MTEADILDSRYSWLRLGLSLLIATVGNVGMWAIIVVMPDMQAEFAIDRADAAMPYTLTMIGFALGNLVIGRVVDRFGITVALSLAAMLIGGGMGLAALSPSVAVLSALQVVIGFGTAASFGPLIADVSLWFLRRRGIAVAIAASGNYLSGAVWPVVLSGVLAEHGWRGVYVALACITVAVMIPLSVLLRRRVPLAATARADMLSGQRADRAGIPPRTMMLMLGLAGIGCCVAMAMPQVHIVSLCVDLGYGPAIGGQMLSLMLLGGVLSRLVSGLVADRLGGVRTLLIGSALQCLALFLYLPSGGLVSLYMVSAVFGLASGRHRAQLRPRGAGIHAQQGGRAACRLRADGDDPRHGPGRLDVRLDLRPDGQLPHGLHQRDRLELSQYRHHGPDPVAHRPAARAAMA